MCGISIESLSSNWEIPACAGMTFSDQTLISDLPSVALAQEG
jgi:hypothetical protein